MKKIFILTGFLVALGSCTKNLTSLNVDPKSPITVPSYTLFSNAQLNLANYMATPNVNTNIWRLISQHWTETTYTDESNYDLVTRDIPQSWWHGMYRDVLKNLDASASLIPSDVTNADQIKNELAIINIMKVYAYHYIVTTFGNIPYSQALDFNNLQPTYDDAKTVYSQMLTTLNSAIADLNSAADGFGDADLLYNGDIDLWKKFANSFKLKMGMMMADYDAAAAKTAVESASSAGIFASNGDNAVFHFLSSPPNTNPVWVNLVQSGRKDFVAANTLVDAMNAVNDPRVPLYFTVDNGGTYTGGPYGESNNYSTYSKPSETVQAPDFPTVFLDYSEIEFLLAEAVERGFSVSGTAAAHYDNAITASIESWGGTAGDAATYLAQSSIAYSTAAGTYKQKIGNQKWIALYERGIDAWTEWRRLDYPALVAPPDALTAIPLRYTYPVTEQNLNKTNYEAASSTIGGDKVTTKLWFDKF
jgi:Starch-binding associating with outer membrane